MAAICRWGGGALTNFDVRNALTLACESFCIGSDSVSWERQRTLVGITLGAGVQYASGSTVSLGVEYFRTEYSNQDFSTRGAVVEGAGFNPTSSRGVIEDHNLSTDTVRAVLNYNLGN